MSVYTRTLLALGAGSRKVMVLSALTSGERTLVTTLASTPGPRPRPAGPLPPGGLLLIWAWRGAATSAASAVAGRTRRIRFIVSSLFQPRVRRGWLSPRRARRVPECQMARFADAVEIAAGALETSDVLLVDRVEHRRRGRMKRLCHPQ